MKKKDRTLEKVLLCYFLITSVIIVAVKHREFHYLFRKYVKGENLVIINHRVVDLDQQQRQKVIYAKPAQKAQRPYSNQDQSKEYHGSDVIYIGSEEENRRRIAQIDRNIQADNQRREQLKRRQQTIDCWVGKDGKKIYSNMPPFDKTLQPCQ